MYPHPASPLKWPAVHDFDRYHSSRCLGDKCDAMLCIHRKELDRISAGIPPILVIQKENP